MIIFYKSELDLIGCECSVTSCTDWKPLKTVQLACNFLSLLIAASPCSRRLSMRGAVHLERAWCIVVHLAKVWNLHWFLYNKALGHWQGHLIMHSSAPRKLVKSILQWPRGFHFFSFSFDEINRPKLRHYFLVLLLQHF